MRKFFLIFLTFISITFINCTGANVMTGNIGPNTNPTPEYSSIFNFIKGGGFYHRHTQSGSIGFNAEPLLTSSSCSYTVLYLIAFGDSSILTSKGSEINKIAYIEYEQFAILGSLFHRFCAKVTGSANSPESPAKSQNQITPPETGKKGK